jgi:hypothetical protein
MIRRSDRTLSRLLPYMDSRGYVIPPTLSYQRIWNLASSGLLPLSRDGRNYQFHPELEAQYAELLGLERADTSADNAA